MSELNLKQMPFLAHLAELRSRLAKVLIAVAITTVFSLFFISDIFNFLTSPLKESFSKASLIGTGPADAFIVKLKLGLAAGLILSLPICFGQVWEFIKPGLHANEKKLALPFVFLATVFFISGAAFCFYIVLPYAFIYFADEFLDLGVQAAIKIDEYFLFVVKLMLVFGIVFELPILSFFFARLGLLSHKWLIDKARYIIVGIFIVAGILTPPDALTQIMLAIPLCIIYAICIGVSYFFGKEKI